MEAYMPKETMTPKERWLPFCAVKSPTGCPWITGLRRFSAKLIKHLGFSRKSERQMVEELTVRQATHAAPRRGL